MVAMVVIFRTLKACRQRGKGNCGVVIHIKGVVCSRTQAKKKKNAEREQNKGRNIFGLEAYQIIKEKGPNGTVHPPPKKKHNKKRGRRDVLVVFFQKPLTKTL